MRRALVGSILSPFPIENRMDVVFRYYFFVFCTDPSGMFDERTPAGGIAVRAWRRKTARQRARQIARERYAQSQHDRVLVLLARRRIDRYHVELMDDAWRRWTVSN